MPTYDELLVQIRLTNLMVKRTSALIIYFGALYAVEEPCELLSDLFRKQEFLKARRGEQIRLAQKLWPKERDISEIWAW